MTQDTTATSECAFPNCKAVGDYEVFMVLGPTHRLYRPLFCFQHVADREAVEVVRQLVALVESWALPREGE